MFSMTLDDSYQFFPTDVLFAFVIFVKFLQKMVLVRRRFEGFLGL